MRTVIEYEQDSDDLDDATCLCKSLSWRTDLHPSVLWERNSTSRASRTFETQSERTCSCFLHNAVSSIELESSPDTEVDIADRRDIISSTPPFDTAYLQYIRQRSCRTKIASHHWQWNDYSDFHRPCWWYFPAHQCIVPSQEPEIPGFCGWSGGWGRQGCAQCWV